jgi:hypothetical protein
MFFRNIGSYTDYTPLYPRRWQYSYLQQRLPHVLQNLATFSWFGVLFLWKSRVSSNKQTNSVALSPRANYTDRATATCQRNLVQTFVDRGVSRGQRGGSPTVVNLSFLDRSRYFFFQVAPHLSSQGLSGPLSKLCYLENLAAVGIEPGTSGTVARNSDH